MCLSAILVKKAGSRLKDGSLSNNIWAECGKCPECLKKRVDGWVFRLMEEDKRSISSEAVTLTYNTEHVPITKNGFMTLNKRHIQDFFRRLRKLQPTEYTIPNDPQNEVGEAINPIKYYLAGEYGTKDHRPHYHIILFNLKDRENAAKAWTSPETGLQMGNIHFGDKVEPRWIAYTCKYIDKGKTVPAHDRDDREKEFSLMSKKLGSNYLTPQIIKYHQYDYLKNQFVQMQGKKIAMPRYYRDKIFTDEQKKEYALFAQDSKMSQDKKDEMDYYQNKPEHEKRSWLEYKAMLEQEKYNKINRSNQNRKL